MMERNRLITKHLRFPRFIMAVYAFAGVLLFFSVTGVLDASVDKNKDLTVFNVSTCAGVAVLIALVCIWSDLDLKKNANKFAIEAAKKYIQKSIVSYPYPDFKDFQEVLSVPEAMQELATFISNQLTPGEQERILNIVSEMPISDNIPKQQLAIVINRACEDITKVLNGWIDKDGIRHDAHPDPTFMSDVYIKLAGLHHRYVVLGNKQETKNTKTSQNDYWEENSKTLELTQKACKLWKNNKIKERNIHHIKGS